MNFFFKAIRLSALICLLIGIASVELCAQKVYRPPTSVEIIFNIWNGKVLSSRTIYIYSPPENFSEEKLKQIFTSIGCEHRKPQKLTVKVFPIWRD
jgi:hypothetical protein